MEGCTSVLYVEVERAHRGLLHERDGGAPDHQLPRGGVERLVDETQLSGPGIRRLLSLGDIEPSVIVSRFQRLILVAGALELKRQTLACEV